MLCYRDITFCGSPPEQCTCGNQVTEKDREGAQRLGLPIAYAYFCGEPNEEEKENENNT